MRWGDTVCGSNLVLAPMAGWTDLPFRLLAAEFGAGLVYTEMISAMGLIREGAKTWELIATDPAEAPLVVQIFGNDPGVMAEATAELNGRGVRMLDLNLGCPARKVVRQGSGSALLKDLDLAREIFRRVRSVFKGWLSVKFRTGWSQELTGPVAVKAGLMAREEGLDGLAVHPRYTRQGFGGAADWSVIREVVEAVELPVLGSGDVTGPESAERMLSETGCAGLMIGRAALGKPWIFDQILDSRAGAKLAPKGAAEIRSIVNRHIDLLVRFKGPVAAWSLFKGWAGYYLKGLPLAKPVKQEIYRTRNLDQVRDLLDGYFERLIRDGVEVRK